jgi:2-iminobutanoate/2-iminopropanoate deaminase
MRFRMPLTLLAVLAILPATVASQQREVIPPNPNPNPNANLSGALKIGNQMWLSGQLGEVTGDIEHETRTALEKVRNLLTAGGFEMRDVVAVQLYITDLADFQKMNGVYRSFFPDHPRPTRTTVQVAGLVNNAKIEVTVTAVKDR